MDVDEWGQGGSWATLQIHLTFSLKSYFSKPLIFSELLYMPFLHPRVLSVMK